MNHVQAGAGSSACRHRFIPERVLVRDVPIDIVDSSSVLACFGEFLECGTTHLVHQVSVHPINAAATQEPIRRSLQQSSLNVPDSVGVTWALSRLHGVRHDRIPGVETLKSALVLGSERQLKHAFVGSTPSTLSALSRAVTGHAPQAILTDMIAPPFREITLSGVAEDLEQLRERPDILWVGLGTPRQHEWAAHAFEMEAAPIVATIGAAFDFMAGTRSRGPAVFRDNGLEWLYRFGSEPRRLWRRYLVGNPQYVLAVERQRRRQSS